jgi:2-dehydro-3-deoxyphosphogluconate aldolase / (4S)-4-hydroxy-2-oxoglutarate aldolase
MKSHRKEFFRQMNRTDILNIIEKEKAVAVLRISDADLFAPVAEALYNGGIRILEITMTVPNAIGLIKKASESLPEDMLLGVGSVLDAETAQRAVDAGAQFVVSPVVKEEIIQKTGELGKPVMAGAFTPTEIQRAWELGSDIVKVFPANIVGMDFFKAVKAPMPHLKLMPTGGVSLINGREWLAAGACAVGVGSALVSSDDLKKRDFKKIEKNARVLIENLHEDITK